MVVIFGAVVPLLSVLTVLIYSAALSVVDVDISSSPSSSSVVVVVVLISACALDDACGPGIMPQSEDLKFILDI